MNTEYRVEKKRVKWFLIGAISLVAFIFSFIICFFSKILFGGIAVISGTLLMLSAFFVIKINSLMVNRQRIRALGKGIKVRTIYYSLK